VTYLGFLYLNRQDIALIESRDVPHTNFFQFQNFDHLKLIDSLLTPKTACTLLNEKLLSVFKLKHIDQCVNITEEPFFKQLIITCAFNVMRDLISRTRIQISNQFARNMFGIVDEYGVLDYGQVFIQYSIVNDGEFEMTQHDHSSNYKHSSCILQGRVIVTKNPCHHPGDLRVFNAVDCRQLHDLHDVIVFPQKGHRPHSNEISGSDLDGSFRSMLIDVSIAIYMN
jgi:RNA-dependent RNA polymerase